MQNLDMTAEFCDTKTFGNIAVANLCVDKQKLTDFSIAKDPSSFSINHENNRLQLHVKDINLEFSMAFDLWSEPKWLMDHGEGSIKVEHAEIRLDLIPTNLDGHLQLDF